ncbi:hypothetical protein B0H14DRAFT_3719096 [Mycena olivaceomarginata]|nr:hypothetical protein B0H14DRAFT_3719096 [Mycena olivaceomarginata]
MTPIPMATSPWLFRGPTERLCRALAADMNNSVAPTGHRLGPDPDAKQGRVPLNFKSTRKGVISCFNIVAPLYEKFAPFPYVNPTWQLELIVFFTARAEQMALTNDPAPSIERLVERARRCVVAYGGILCHILAIISEVEVPAMVSLSFTGGATPHLAFGSTINANQLVPRTPGSMKKRLRSLRRKDLRQFNPDIAFRLSPQIKIALAGEELSLAEMVPSLVALSDRIPGTVQKIDWSAVHRLLSNGAFPGRRRHLQRDPASSPSTDLLRTRLPAGRTYTQAPNLVQAGINIDFEEQHWPDYLETVVLLHLRRLDISNLSGALKYLKTPALEELALVDGGEDTLPPFHSLLDRSSCSLRRLCRIWSRSTAQTTTKILQSSSRITELIVIGGGEVDALVETLALCLIFIGCERGNCVDYQACLQMLESRRTTENCALRSAALLVADGPKPELATILLMRGGDRADIRCTTLPNKDTRLSFFIQSRVPA